MKKKSTLSKKLASYSALATIVLAGSKSSDAQILYTDVNPDDTIHVVGDYLLDLNNDGTIDFHFNLTHKATLSGGTYSSVDQIRVVGYGSNSVLRDPSPPYSSYPYAQVLLSGALIGGSATFSYQDILATNSDGYSYWGDWRGVSNAFLGLKLSVNFTTYYGWARLSVDSVCDELIVSDYAVDTVANQAIIAGDKCGNYAAYVNTVINPSDSVSFCGAGTLILATDSIDGFTYQWLMNGNVIGGADNSSYTADASGNYSVIATNSYGCVDTAAATQVNFFPLPAIPVILQTGDTLNSTTAASYQWYFTGVLIPGATGQTYAPSQEGDYTVQTTDANGCVSVSDPYHFIPIGISNSGDPDISVFEANNIVFIQLNEAKLLGGEIRIFNALGSNVYSSRVNIETLQIDLNHMPTGIYLLTIEKDGKSIARKIVIQ